jgi:uncharacterized protein VcgC/VcgE DUF2780
MFRSSVLATVFLLAVCAVSGCAEMQSMGLTDPLVTMLISQLGVTTNQATGGVGSMLTLGREKLSSMDFNSLTKMIPGSETYVKAAKDLGAVTGPVGDTAGLQSAFSRLGMGSNMVGKFSGVLSDYVGKAGGEPAKQLLAAMLK